MIRSISVTNYKAFTSATLQVKPLTILLGANSSGKSSLLQLLLLLGQSIQSQSDYDGAFKLNGQYASCGEAINLLHRRVMSNNFSLSFEIEPITIKKSDAFNFCIRQILYLLEWSCKGEEKYASIVKEFSKEIQIQNTAEFIQELSELSNFIKGKILKNKRKKTKENIDSTLKLGRDDELEILEITYDAIEVLAATLGAPKINKIEYTFYYNNSTRELETKKISLQSENSEIIGFSNRRSNGYKARDLTSDHLPKKILNKYRTDFYESNLANGLTFGKIGFYTKSDFQIVHPVLGMLAAILNDPLKVIFDSFGEGRINHVSPLRAFPQRYYVIAQSHNRASLNTKDGDSLVEMLKKRTDVRGRVNKWLTNFKLKVEVQDVKEVIHSIKVTQNKLSLDITDVGFGISQILPVIVQGFVAPDNSITVIEQPEIHLHPKMQGDLADLAIDITKSGNNKRLVIETHSEYLLKRLRRRIAEGEILSDNVAIYLVNSNPVNGTSFLEEVTVAPRGSFKWPNDFTDKELEDTIAFAMLQPNSIDDREGEDTEPEQTES